MKSSAVRAVRLMYIRDLLGERPRSVQELADMCGVTRKTIYADLLDLQMEPLSLPLVFDCGRWKIMDWRSEI